MKPIKKLIISTIIISFILTITGCSKSKETDYCLDKKEKIEAKYGITICYGKDKIKEKSVSSYKLLDNERKVDAILDEIDDYFSKLPEGFIEEVTTFDSDDATEIVILILKKDSVGVSFNDREHEYWLVNESDTDMDLAGDMMYSMMFHAKYSPKRDGFLSDWNDYNPDGFTYGSSSKNKKYLCSSSNIENGYFLLDETMEDPITEVQLLFSMLWDDECMEKYNAINLPRIVDKMKFLCSEISRIFDTVDETAYWNRYFTEDFNT